ncbi:MAG: hypothetical protein GY720_16270 [bacterium]|nr:hypothetical protein [bacterium]
MGRSLSVAASAVEFGSNGGDGFDAGFGVAGEGAWILVSVMPSIVIVDIPLAVHS